MDNKIKKQILEAIQMVPGLEGLADLDHTKSAKALTIKDLAKGYEVEQNNGVLNITMAIIINGDIKSKDLFKRLNVNLKETMKKLKLKVGKTNVVIRGVK